MVVIFRVRMNVESFYVRVAEEFFLAYLHAAAAYFKIPYGWKLFRAKNNRHFREQNKRREQEIFLPQRQNKQNSRDQNAYKIPCRLAVFVIVFRRRPRDIFLIHTYLVYNSSSLFCKLT